MDDFQMELGGEWLIWKHNHPMARNKGGGGGGTTDQICKKHPCCSTKTTWGKSQ